MGFLKPKVIVPPPPPALPEVTKIDQERASALAQEAMTEERKQRRGRKSTVVAGTGALGGQTQESGGKPTLLG